MKNLTIHTLTPVAWGNLNRDDLGMPKTTIYGGIQRSLLSPQSLKRAARIAFESIDPDRKTYRSTDLARLVAAQAIERANEDIDRHKIAEQAVIAIESMVKGKDKVKPGSLDVKKHAKQIVEDLDALGGKVIVEIDEGAEQEKGKVKKETKTASWLSADEITATVATVLEAVREDTNAKVPANTNTSMALSIASMGRMMANQHDLDVEAAISVSPAVSVHETVVEADFFTTVDDLAAGSGAAHMGNRFNTSGIFYRSFTIDRDQLRRNWPAIDTPDARQAVRDLLEALVGTLPSGRSTNSAPYVTPLVVLAEEQRHRTALDFETPVRSGADGGYTQPSVQEFSAQVARARTFRPSGFGQSWLAASVDTEGLFAGIDRPGGGLDGVLDAASVWVVDRG